MHYTGKGLERLKRIYDKAELKVLCLARAQCYSKLYLFDTSYVSSMSYPTFTPEKLIVDWFNRSQKRTEGFTLFDQFISLWLAFNSWGTYLSNEDTDWKMLDYLKTNTELRTMYRMLMESDAEFLGKVQRLAQYRVLDMRPGHENESKSITNHNDFGQLLDVIYQIRCNLFHGQKSETDRHDRELVELAHYILSKIFTPIAERLKKG